MGALLTACKTALFTVGVALIIAGSNLLQSNLAASILLLIIGIILIMIYTYLIEKQTVEKTVKLVADKFRW